MGGCISRWMDFGVDGLIVTSLLHVKSLQTTVWLCILC